jgi:hypothetical protein
LAKLAASLRSQATEQRRASQGDAAGQAFAGGGGGGGGGGGFGADQPQKPSEILERYQVADDEVVAWEPSFPASLATDPTRLTKTEAGLLDSLSPLNQWDFRNIVDDSFSEAEARFPLTTDTAAKQDSHQDAFRHAFWNARMTAEFGPEFATKYGTAHEGLPGNPGSREAMDLFNNEVGRRIAIDHPDASTAELAELVERAVNDGNVVVLDGGGQIAYSDQVRVGEHGHPIDPPRPGGRPAEPADSDDAARGTGS